MINKIKTPMTPIETVDKINEIIDGVNSGGNGSVGKFTDLTDTPNSYTGAGGKVVAVKNDGTGLEFKTVEGGSGGEAGRVVLEATEDNVINIDNIHSVQSYVIKGNIEYVQGLPEYLYEIAVIGVSYMEISLDVLYLMYLDENKEEYVVTQRISFLDARSVEPDTYDRVCMYIWGEIASYPWRAGSGFGVKYRRLGRLYQLLMDIGNQEYVLAFHDSELSDGALITDALMVHGTSDIYSHENVFPNMRFSNVGNYLQTLLGGGSCYLSNEKDGGDFIIAFLRFEDPSIYDYFMQEYRDYEVFLEYRQQYNVEDLS